MVDQEGRAAGGADSSRRAVERFDTADAAGKYAGRLDGTPTDRRERRCIRRALAGLPNAAAVLDLPCGAGRLLPLLTGLGLTVTAADSSPHMIDQARRYAAALGLDIPDERFRVADVMATGFPDEAFDAVVCNRLFHHFTEPRTRQEALAELGRICRGPIVVSFFRNLSWDAAAFHAKNFLRRRRPRDRVPINLGTLKRDIRSAGLVLTRTLAARALVSKQWYVVLRRAV